jgi:large subunit ribosomal protein L24
VRGEKHTLVEQAYPIHISNVSLIDPQSGKATRVGARKEGAKKVRVARKSGKDIA